MKVATSTDSKSTVSKCRTSPIVPTTPRPINKRLMHHTAVFCKGSGRKSPQYANPYAPARAKHRAIPTVIRYGSGCHQPANCHITSVMPYTSNTCHSHGRHSRCPTASTPQSAAPRRKRRVSNEVRILVVWLSAFIKVDLILR